MARHPQLKSFITLEEPASGGGSKVYMRVAKVFSLMDLFAALGHRLTADDLYRVYLSCPS